MQSVTASITGLADRLVTGPRTRHWLANRRNDVAALTERAGRTTRRHGVTVPLDKLLIGGPGGVPDEKHLARVRDKRWASLTIPESPHVELYQRFSHGETIPDDPAAFDAIPYVQLAHAAIAASGSFCGCTDDAALRAHITSLRASFEHGETEGDASPLVRAVQHSSYFAVLRGNHRLAGAWVRGERTAHVDVAFGSLETPVQQLLANTGWLSGQQEIYQPLPMPEIHEAWPLIRACTDRFSMMKRHLDDHGIAGGSYLDIASCYGWFVDQMRRAGFDAQGIERDPHGVELGEIAYDLPSDRVVVGSAEQILRFAERRWNVVSCLSIIHHYAIMGGEPAVAEMLSLLDDITIDVLYFDSGQSHEEWFADRLPGWDDAGIIDAVKAHTSFTNIEILGVDADNVDPYPGNYGRTMFACTRS